MSLQINQCSYAEYYKNHRAKYYSGRDGDNQCYNAYVMQHRGTGSYCFHDGVGRDNNYHRNSGKGISKYHRDTDGVHGKVTYYRWNYYHDF